MDCTCNDWMENWPKLLAPAMMLSARNPGSGDYKGKVFKFCPWCAKSLAEKLTIPLDDGDTRLFYGSNSFIL